MADLSAVFEAAGLRFLGHWFGGEKWSESFITDLDGIDDRLRDEILAVHRSPVIPEANGPIWWRAGMQGRGSRACRLVGPRRPDARFRRRPVDRLGRRRSGRDRGGRASPQTVGKRDCREERQWESPRLAARRESRRDGDLPTEIGRRSRSSRGYRVLQRLRRVRGGWRLAAAGANGWSGSAGNRCTATALTSGACRRRRPDEPPANGSASGWRPAAVCRERCLRKARRRSGAPAAAIASQPGWNWTRFSARPRTARASSSIRRSSTGIGCVSGRTN